MCDTTPQPETVEQAAVELVPEFWPPADPIEPVRAWRIHWLLAPLATIPAVLLPRRMGPHLANSSWAAAYVAHLFSGFVAVGTVFAVAFTFRSGAEPSLASVFLCNPLVELRRALAGSILFLYGMWNGWMEILGTLLALAGIEAGIWIGGLLLIPLYAVGEGARRTYVRCVKLLLWSSACQMPIAWLFMHFAFWADTRLYDENWVVSAWVTCELWWLWAVVRLGGRYGGPKEGPRWQDRRPRCEACGYSLVSLQTDGRCPECGIPVAESLPERRRPPAFATARGLLRRFVGFWETTWQAMSARRFARGLAVWRDHRAGRVYVLIICLLVGLIAAATGIGVYAIAVEFPSPEQPGVWLGEFRPSTVFAYSSGLVAVTLICAICGTAIPAVWMLKTGVFLCHFGFRDMADRVVILYYSTAWLLVPILLAIGGGWASYGIVETWGPFQSFRVAEDTWIDWEAVLWIAFQIPAAATLLMSFLRIRVMLRHTRYANA
jgi:hypothetical protein